MIRILALTIPTLMCFVGIIGLFHFQGIIATLMAILLIVIGGGGLWWIEKKTIHHLDEDTWWSSIMNKGDDGYG